ncbi:hypothetical protein UFOVP248_77 [uncultured Caudovirales phage]|uniref:Uncharacterized protein n=1 Tax=uncultured Caudovirales phage TaxID=2100421 RepID=A0A6J5LEW9_9CAUD|nr:hypothetical protein UFOVP248_77 [uncultured Caudovirales phage]
MNKSDFIDWKRHPVTQVIFSQLNQRIDDLQVMLGDSAGVNPVQDSQFVGAIKAYKDMVNIEYEGEEETL